MASERYSEPQLLPDDYEPPRRVSHDEYPRLAEEVPGKYEYHAGLMYPRFYPPGSHWAMADGTVAHDQLTLRMLLALGNHVGVRGPCQVHTSDLKLKVAENHYFPDAYVSRGDTHPRQTRLEDAVLICEVRSQSTAEFDRGDKFAGPMMHQHSPTDDDP